MPGLPSFPSKMSVCRSRRSRLPRRRQSSQKFERNHKVLYSLKITRRLTNDTSLVNAFQSGVVFNPAVVRVFDNTFSPLTTYTLANASVLSVRHTGATSDGFVTEEIALLATSLSVTTP